MLRSRFLWKLYAGYAFLILLATGLVGGLVAVRVESETLAEIDRRLQGEAMLLRAIAVTAIAEPVDPGAASPAPDTTSQLQERIHRLGQEAGTRFTVIDADGTVLADSEETPTRMDNHGTRPEVLAARDQGIGLSSRFSATLRQQMRYLALPCQIDGELVGYARVSLPLTALGERLAQLRSVVLLAAGIASVVALLLGFLHARRITRPVLSMVEAVEALAANRYQSRVELDSQDELGTLARAFNSMSQELRTTVDTLDADRNKLTAILASMEEGVVAVDHTERIVHMNQVAGQLLEADPETSLDRPLWEVVRLHELSAALSETLEHEQPVHRVLQLPASGGQDRTLELHSSPLETHDGRLVGAVIVLDDVTQLRRLERVRRDFFGNVSHELKTPVAAIHGLVETMMDDPEMETPQRQRFLGKVIDQSDRLANLVTDLLSLSRLESGGVPELLPLDVRHTIEDSIRTLQTTAEAKGVGLETDLPPESLTIEGEEETLRQAVGNLLDNAVKYTPEGGRVVVRARRALDAEGDRVVVTVEDTGIGIEARHLERIFERFYRVDKARSRAVGGTGLGLAIVKHSVLAMGGDISVESRPGRGTTFRIDLPHLDEGTETGLVLDLDDAPSAPAA